MLAASGVHGATEEISCSATWCAASSSSLLSPWWSLGLEDDILCVYGSESAGRSWTCRAVRRLGTGNSQLSLG